jgi:hypothetical protein
MAVHMVRVLFEPPRGEAENAVSNCVSNYQEWDGDPVTHALTETNTELDGSGVQYLRGDWRFIQNGETPTDILQDLSDRLQSMQGGLWHRLGYHVCTHDEENPQGCSWEYRAEYGTIPDGVSL